MQDSSSLSCSQTNDEDAPHVRAYKLLRVELYRYEANGGSLTRITPPVGGKQWIRYQAEVEKMRAEFAEAMVRLFARRKDARQATKVATTTQASLRGAYMAGSFA